DMKTLQSKNGLKKRIRRPLRMLDFAKRRLKLRVVKDESFADIQQIMNILKENHIKEGFRVASFLPVKGYRIDRDGNKKYFYYLLYWRGSSSYKVQPSVVLIGVGSSEFVNGLIKDHLQFVKDGGSYSYSVPAPFIRKFERNYQTNA
ncbi:MAG: hypothetical protein NZZ41_06935, partial [Candidatus Dojkabacteria bacterium]|nr:hypothetical protein [Candidatus Dojkabacteria bacterium]